MPEIPTFEVVIIWSNVPDEVKTYVGNVEMDTLHRLESFHGEYINGTDDETMVDFFYDEKGLLWLDESDLFSEVTGPYMASAGATILTMGFLL